MAPEDAAAEAVKLEPAAICAQREEALKSFQAKMIALGREDLRRKYAWYHTVDLGNGILTPGVYDYRDLLPRFHFPEDMRGMEVLDVGSATGFFAFEFEKRGAAVTSVELASMADWDMPPGEDRSETIKHLMARHGVDTLEEVDYLQLEGPFRLCHEMLRSKAKRLRCTVYNMSRETLGADAFDLVFVGDVLLHLFSPLKALCAIAPLCRGTLVVSQGIPTLAESTPVMLYLGGDRRVGDGRTWWYPNRSCFRQMLARVGFTSVEFVDEFSILNRLDGTVNHNTVLHARK